MSAIALTARGLVNRRSYLERSNGEEARNFLKRVFVNRSVGEIAQIGDMTKGGAKNLKGGRHGVRFENLIAMCRNDPAFRADFNTFCTAYIRQRGAQQPT